MCRRRQPSPLADRFQPRPASAAELCGQRDNMSLDRKSTRLNSSHSSISYAVFCLKKKKQITKTTLKKTQSTPHPIPPLIISHTSHQCTLFLMSISLPSHSSLYHLYILYYIFSTIY